MYVLENYLQSQIRRNIFDYIYCQLFDIYYLLDFLLGAKLRFMFFVQTS